MDILGVSEQIIIWLLLVVTPIVAMLVLIGWVTFRVWALWNKGKKKRLISKIRQGLFLTHTKFYYNFNAGILAVCSEKAFKEGIAEHMSKVKAHEIGLWEKVVCYAEPTFTFSEKSSNWRPVHTGFIGDLEIILNNLVHEATGLSLETLSRKEREEALKHFLIRDESLFVPFSGSGKPSPHELGKYPPTTLSEAISQIKLLNR